MPLTRGLPTIQPSNVWLCKAPSCDWGSQHPLYIPPFLAGVCCYLVWGGWSLAGPGGESCRVRWSLTNPGGGPYGCLSLPLLGGCRFVVKVICSPEHCDVWRTSMTNRYVNNFQLLCLIDFVLLLLGHANYPPHTTQTCALCRLFCVLFLCPCFPCVACTAIGGEE